MVQVWENCAAISRLYSHPLCNGHHDTLPGIPGNESPAAYVIQVPFQQGGWELVVDFTTFDLATQHDMVSSPPVVSALPIGCQGAAEIGSCDQDH